MTKDDVLETFGYVVVVVPAVLGISGLFYGWNAYTVLALILGSFVLLATYEFAKR